MVRDFQGRFHNILERAQRMTEQICDKFQDKNRKIQSRIEDQLDKLKDQIEEKARKMTNRFEEANEKLFDEFREAMENNLRVIENMRDTLCRDLEKAPKHTIMGGDEMSITIRTIPNPETFLPEFKETGRLDFVNHYLEYKFQSRFRGNHTGRTWEYNVNEQKYKFRDSTEIIDIMLGTMPEFNKCFLTGPGFEFFRANSEDFIQHIEPLNNRTIKQFLIYMHNKLPPLRT